MPRVSRLTVAWDLGVRKAWEGRDKKGDENVLELMMVIVLQVCGYTKALELFTSER